MELSNVTTSPIAETNLGDLTGGDAGLSENGLGSQLRVVLADKLGICLSSVCVVHCLLTPVLLILIPSLEVSEYHEFFHRGLLLILPILAVAAFIPGFRRHRDAAVFYWSIPGLVFVGIGALAFSEHAWEQIAFTVFGSLLLIRAHVINRRRCACCEASHGRNVGGSSDVEIYRQMPSVKRERLLSKPKSSLVQSSEKHL